MTSPQPRLKAILLGVAGVLLIALAAVLHFVMPQLRPEEHLFNETWLLSAGAVRIAAAASVTGGAWLLVLAWNSRPSKAVDDEAAGD
jgi:protein-S-isoprenylcysteine O-methyltransferase Ste14